MLAGRIGIRLRWRNRHRWQSAAEGDSPIFAAATLFFWGNAVSAAITGTVPVNGYCWRNRICSQSEQSTAPRISRHDRGDTAKTPGILVSSDKGLIKSADNYCLG